MTMTQMRYFEAVCRHMNLTKAAHELHISQPALSMAIREIENKCGIELFHHGANSLSITEQGTVLYDEVKNIMRQYDYLQYMISHGMLSRNFIRLGYGMMSMSAFLPTIIRRFRDEHPDVKLFLKEGPAIQTFDLLDNDKLDMIIVNSRHLESRQDKLESGKFSRVPLISMRMSFAVSVNNSLANKGRVDWEDIVKQPLALLKSPSKMIEDVRSQLNSAGYELPPNAYFVDQIYTLLRFIEEDAAASFVPSTVAYGNAKIALLDYPASYTTDVALIYRRDYAQIETVRQFIEITKGYFDRKED